MSAKATEVERANPQVSVHMSKVPAATIAFWLVKISLLVRRGRDDDCGHDHFGLFRSDPRARVSEVVGVAANLAGVIALLIAWRQTTGAVAFDRITSRTDEIFYWVTIVVSNTLGTALGDFVATTADLGFERGALVFAALIALIGIATAFTRAPRSLPFWAAYVLTRPLGATLGDTLTKPHAEGGLALGRVTSSMAIAAAMVLLLVATSRRPGREASA